MVQGHELPQFPARQLAAARYFPRDASGDASGRLPQAMADRGAIEMDRGGAKIDTTDGNAFQSSWTITLPTDVRNNDSRLQAIARNLLQLPRRPLGDDRWRKPAGYRAFASRPFGQGQHAEVPAHVFHEPHAGQTVRSEDSSLISWVDPSDRSVSYIAAQQRTRIQASCC